MNTKWMMLFGLVLAGVLFSGQAFAHDHEHGDKTGGGVGVAAGVPEVDGSSVAAMLALGVGIALVMSGNRRKRPVA